MKKKIILDATQFFDKGTGISNYIYGLYNELIELLLKKDNINIILLQNSNSSKLNNIKNRNLNIKRIPFNKNQNILRNFYMYIFFSLYLKFANADVFISPVPKLPVSTNNIKTIITVHDLCINRFPNEVNFAKNYYWKYRRENAIKNANKIVNISKFTKKELKNIYDVDEDKLEIIYNGFDKERFIRVDNNEKEKAKQIFDLPDKFLLFVGLYSERKNIENLIKSFKNVIKSNRDIKLVLAGSNLKENTFELVKNLNLENDVFYLGYVSDDLLPALYNLATIFMYPSLYEGFGIPILESMACGTPVITSNISSMPEVAGKAALLVDPYDIKDISKKTMKLLKNKKIRDKYKNLGFQNIKKYTWENAAKEMCEIIKKI